MESALPTRGVYAVLYLRPSAAHLATKQKRGTSTFKLLEPGSSGGTLPWRGDDATLFAR